MSEGDSDQALLDALNAVHDEATFVRFLQMLGNDCEDQTQKELAKPSPAYSLGANGWENGMIGAFLESAAAWRSELEAQPGPQLLHRGVKGGGSTAASKRHVKGLEVLIQVFAAQDQVGRNESLRPAASGPARPHAI